MDTEMNDCDYDQLKQDARKIMYGLIDFIERQGDNDKYLFDLQKEIRNTLGNKYNWNMEKIRVILSVLQLKNDDDVEKIMSFLEPVFINGE